MGIPVHSVVGDPKVLRMMTESELVKIVVGTPVAGVLPLDDQHKTTEGQVTTNTFVGFVVGGPKVVSVIANLELAKIAAKVSAENQPSGLAEANYMSHADVYKSNKSSRMRMFD